MILDKKVLARMIGEGRNRFQNGTIKGLTPHLRNKLHDVGSKGRRPLLHHTQKNLVP
jgi:hypothetical protein